MPLEGNSMNVKKIITEKIDVLKKKNGVSPIAGIVLFLVAFSITLWALGGNNQKIDGFTLGQQMREIVDSDSGEVVSVINGVEYYRRDLSIIAINITATDPQFLTLSERQQDYVAGNHLIRQFMLLQEFDRLGLTLEEGEFDAFIQKEKDATREMIANDTAESNQFLKYIEGYGCTYAEYWEDEDVLKSFENSLKYEKAQKKIAENEGFTNTGMNIDAYLAKLLEDGTYVVTLFGEAFE